MYAIVDIAGQQFKVQEDQQVFVHRLENEEGSKVSFDRVLLVDNDGKVEVGAPVISSVSVEGKVVKHLQADKVLVFKKKRRKGYQKLNGHRQQLTEILIESIGKAKPAAKKAPKAVVAEEPKAEAPKAEAKPAPKKTETKKEADKDASSKES